MVGLSSESSQDWSGAKARPTSESASLVALIRVAARRSLVGGTSIASAYYANSIEIELASVKLDYNLQ